jgi:hypothetical protein
MRMLFWIARRARAVLPRAFDLSRRVVRQPKTETRQNEELLHSTPLQPAGTTASLQVRRQAATGGGGGSVSPASM